ncbi:MAG: MFS transporter [Pirellulales bacterium]
MHSQRVEDVSNLRFMLRALRHRNYRLFFAGQVVSLIGTWLSMIASSWLVYRLATAEGRPAAMLLGLVAFAGQFPLFLLTPLTGVWIDRWSRHAILVTTQTLSMLQSFVLAALVLSDWITIPQIIVLNALQGIVSAWDVPARQAFTVELIEDRDDLSNAIALSSSTVHAARLVGPAVGGYLIYAVGEGLCFLIDGVSFLAVIGALLAMRVKPVLRREKSARALASLREGVSYAAGFAPIRTLLTVVAVTSLTSMSQSTLMPIFAANILGGGERTLGWMLGATGLGALAGSLYLASRRSVIGLGRVIAIAGLALGFAMMGLAWSRLLLLSIPLLAVIGLCLVVQMASCNTMLQTIVDDDKRGRVMALFAMAFLGVAPLGSLWGGAVATMFGAPTTVTIAAIGCWATAAYFAFRLPALRPLIRPIYETKGILPQMARALESTEALEDPTQD